jgi:GNAT superfamily N-acetyltransferase
MEPREVAQLVEFSEARAYGSLLAASSNEFREANGVTATWFGSALAIVARSVTNTLNMNRVIGLGVAEPADERALDQIVALYAKAGVPYGIEVGPCSQPADLPGWLKKRRIRRGVATAMLYRTAEQLADRPGPVKIVRATGRETRSVAEICCRVFRMPEVAQALIAEAAERPAWRHWLAYIGSEPIGAALSFVEQGVAWLGWDATLPHSRGRGAQAALIAARLSDAASNGCSYVTSETAASGAGGTDPSFRNYQRMGFCCAYERYTYVAVRGAAAAGAAAA